MNLAGVVETFELVGELFEALDTEEGGRRADGDEQIVVVDGVAAFELDCALVDVHVGRATLDELRRVVFDVVDRDGDAGLDARVADAAVDLVEDEVVVVFGDPRELRVRTELFFEGCNRAGPGVPRAENDDLRAHVVGCAVIR